MKIIVTGRAASSYRARASLLAGGHEVVRLVRRKSEGALSSGERRRVHPDRGDLRGQRSRARRGRPPRGREHLRGRWTDIRSVASARAARRARRFWPRLWRNGPPARRARLRLRHGLLRRPRRTNPDRRAGRARTSWRRLPRLGGGGRACARGGRPHGLHAFRIVLSRDGGALTKMLRPSVSDSRQVRERQTILQLDRD